MAQKAFTMVFYIVPEDQDDIEQPNAFGIHKNQEDIKPSDIADSFPLPGEYIFRFTQKQLVFHGQKIIIASSQFNHKQVFRQIKLIDNLQIKTNSNNSSKLNNSHRINNSKLLNKNMLISNSSNLKHQSIKYISKQTVAKNNFLVRELMETKQNLPTYLTIMKKSQLNRKQIQLKQKLICLIWMIQVQAHLQIKNLINITMIYGIFEIILVNKSEYIYLIQHYQKTYNTIKFVNIYSFFLIKFLKNQAEDILYSKVFDYFTNYFMLKNNINYKRASSIKIQFYILIKNVQE